MSLCNHSGILSEAILCTSQVCTSIKEQKPIVIWNQLWFLIAPNLNYACGDGPLPLTLTLLLTPLPALTPTFLCHFKRRHRQYFSMISSVFYDKSTDGGWLRSKGKNEPHHVMGEPWTAAGKEVHKKTVSNASKWTNDRSEYCSPHVNNS